MKVGIVVPYSWSYWGGVVEHASYQAEALRRLGVETRILVGCDPPGRRTKLLHPRLGRTGSPPEDVISLGRSVVTPANGSLSNIVIGPTALSRIRRTLREEKFDLLHLHEPMLPIPCVAALALAEVPVVGTFHAAGKLGWLKLAKPIVGCLLDRLDCRIAVSEQARLAASRFFPGDYEILPNGVFIPERADAGDRNAKLVFIGRHEPRKGLEVLLEAWPQVREETGTRLRLIGADPPAVQKLISRRRFHDDGVDTLGFLSHEQLTSELLQAKALVAPSLGRESFGMVLTRAFACATPAVASDIDGYRDVVTPTTGLLCPPGNPTALAERVSHLLADEPRRQRFGASAREHALEHYGWDRIAARLITIYEGLLG